MSEQQHFPTWRYHRTEKPRVVHTPEELAALGDDWRHSPADFAPTAAAGSAPTPAAVQAPPQSSPFAAALWRDKADVIRSAVETMTDTGHIEMMIETEKANPAGPRSTVLAALRKRLRTLSAE